MALTLKDLVAEQEKRDLAKEKAELEITELETDIEYLESEAQKEAEDGNDNGFLQLKRQANEKRDLLKAKKARIAAMARPFDVAEVQKAWDGFQKEHDKKFDAAMDVLDKAKEQFRQAYEAVFDIQYDGLVTRAQAADLAGIDQHDEHKLRRTFEMKLFPVYGVRVDTGFGQFAIYDNPETKFFEVMSDMSPREIRAVMGNRYWV